MKKVYDLSSASRKWTVSGWIPNLWRLDKTMEVGARPQCEVSPLEAKVPGSLQYTLREAGLIPDWNYGMNGRSCEWVENRHWIYSTVLPEEARTPGKTAYLLCDGIDGFGELFVNGTFVTEFKNSHIDYSIDITKYLKKDGEVYEVEKNFDKAIELYNKIKNEFPQSGEAQDIEKYIERATLSK